VGLIRGFAFNQMQDPFAQPKVGQPLMVPSLDALVQAWDADGPDEGGEPVGSGGPGDGTATIEQQSGAGHATGSFIWPTEGFISQTFGGGHSGLDIANVAGTPVYAADGGTVSFAGWNGAGLGYAVAIEHGAGLQTWYGHFGDVPAVALGQPVAQGDYLGAMGSTGRSTGPHLHFIVVLDAQNQDPLGWLPPR
jgi:murein DD-endopeptidase MepM/ murein hydrolase activator NlpD